MERKQSLCGGNISVAVKMSKVQMLRSFINQRLTTAAQEIFELFERTIVEYEEELSRSKEENERQQRLLHAVFNQEFQIERADVQQLLVVKEEVPPEQQDWSSRREQEDPEPLHIKKDREDQKDPDPPNIKEEQEESEPRHIKEDWADQMDPEPPHIKKEQEDQEDPEPPHIKKEQEDQEDPKPPHIKKEQKDQEDPEPPHIKKEQEKLWTSQEVEQLQGQEEAGIKLSFTPVKSEDNEEEPQSSQLYQRQTEQMETEADGAYCRGPEPSRKLDPERHSGPDTDETESSSELEIDDSRDWKETQEPQSDSNPLQNHDVPVSDVKCSAVNTSISLPECAGSSDHKGYLKIHTSSKTGVIFFSCSVCSKTFSRKADLTRHMAIHTMEKLFSCSVCSKTLKRKADLNRHMTIHTGEKLFSCSVCGKTFAQKRHLKAHTNVHQRRAVGLKLRPLMSAV